MGKKGEYHDFYRISRLFLMGLHVFLNHQLAGKLSDIRSDEGLTLETSAF